MSTRNKTVVNILSDPVAVVISDIHFSLPNLKLASEALTRALDVATEYGVPLIIAGDLQDTKAIIRAEVINELLNVIGGLYFFSNVYVLVGNHDLINEKGKDNALRYLESRCHIISSPTKMRTHTIAGKVIPIGLIPYQSSPKEFELVLSNEEFVPGQILITHQGFLGAQMGDYIKDSSSVSPDVVKDFIVISGHYHRHQTIGTVTYIGSPFTTSFGEANDGDKGFIILKEDGSYDRHILDLRKHVIQETTFDRLDELKPVRQEDLLWVKIRGPKEELRKINREQLGIKLLGHSNYKLDLIPTETEISPVKELDLTHEEILDKIIDSIPENSEELKSLWRDIL